MKLPPDDLKRLNGEFQASMRRGLNFYIQAIELTGSLLPNQYNSMRSTSLSSETVEKLNAEFRNKLQRENATFMQRLHDVEKRRGEFFDRRELNYSSARPDAEILMIKQGEAAIVTPNNTFSHIGTNGVGNCIGIALIGYDEIGNPTGVAVSHLDAARSASKTVDSLAHGVMRLEETEKIKAYICTSQPDVMRLCETVDALRNRGIETNLDTNALAIAVDIKTGFLVHPNSINSFVHLRSEDQFADDRAMLGASMTFEDQKPPASLIIDYSNNRRELPADYGRYQGSRRLSEIRPAL